MTVESLHRRAQLPTYYVDGTEIMWTEDKVMEDFLRTKAPGLKTIDYAPPAQQAH